MITKKDKGLSDNSSALDGKSTLLWSKGIVEGAAVHIQDWQVTDLEKTEYVMCIGQD
jgi:hypothetical protein